MESRVSWKRGQVEGASSWRESAQGDEINLIKVKVLSSFGATTLARQGEAGEARDARGRRVNCFAVA